MTTLVRKMNRISKWRNVFASWQLGTRGLDDPECQAVKDHREATILLRVEVNALAALLTDKGVFTVAEWEKAMSDEIDLFDKDLERRFPGFSVTDTGVSIDTEAARETMKGWPL